MKSKTKFLLVVLMIIGCLALLLVGCKPKPTPAPVEKTAQEIIDEAIGKITDSFAINADDMIGIDVKAAVDYKKKADDGTISAKGTYKGSDLGLEVVAKANVHIYDGARDADNYYLLEFNLYNEANPKGYAVLRLYMENLTNPKNTNESENVMFVQILGSELYKVNAFSVMHLFNQFSGNAQETADLDIASMLPDVIAAMFSDAKVENNVYTLTFNFNGVWELLSGILSGGLDSLIGSDPIIGGMTLDQLLNTAAKELGSALKISYDTGEKNDDGTPKMALVSDVKTLVAYVNENLPAVDCDVVVSFDESDILTGIAANVNVDPKGDDKGFVVNANVSPFAISSDVDLSKADVLKDSFVLAAKNDEGKSIYDTEAKRFEAEAINILNIKTYGSVDILDNSNNVVRAMDFNLDANIDPFALIYGHSQKDFMKMGYFTLDVALAANSDPTDDATFNKDSTPIMQIYFNPAKTGDDSIYIYLALATDNANPFANKDNYYVLATSISLSGLISTITGEEGLVNNDVAAVAETDILTTIKDLLTKIIAAAPFEINGEEGPLQGSLTIDVAKLLEALDANINIIGDFSVRSLLVGNSGSKLRIDVDNFLYGYAEELDFDLARLTKSVNSDKINKGNGYINASTVEVETKEYKAEYGTEFVNVVGESLKVSYLDQAETKHSGISLGIQNVIGYEPTVVGKQEVTLMVAMQSNLGDTLSFAMGMLFKDVEIDIYDYISVIPVKITIDVREPEAAASIRADGVQTLLVGQNIFDVVKPVMVFGNRTIEMNPYNFVGNMNIDASGKTLATGNYTLTFVSSGQTATIDIAVAEVSAANTSMNFGDDIEEKSILSARYANSGGMLIKGDVDNYKITDIRVINSSNADITSVMTNGNSLLTQADAYAAGASVDDLLFSKVVVSSTFSILSNKYERTTEYTIIAETNSLLIDSLNSRTADGVQANKQMPIGLSNTNYVHDDGTVERLSTRYNAEKKSYALYRTVGIESFVIDNSSVKFYAVSDDGRSEVALTDNNGLVKTSFSEQKINLKIVAKLGDYETSRIFPYEYDETFDYDVIKVDKHYDIYENTLTSVVNGKAFALVNRGVLNTFIYNASNGKTYNATTSNASKITMNDTAITVELETLYFAEGSTEGVALVNGQDIVTAPAGNGKMTTTMKVYIDDVLVDTLENIELGNIVIAEGELKGVAGTYYKNITALNVALLTYLDGEVTETALTTADMTLLDSNNQAVANAFTADGKIAESVVAGTYTLSVTKNGKTVTASIKVADGGVIPKSDKWNKTGAKTYENSGGTGIEPLETLMGTLTMNEMFGLPSSDANVFEALGIDVIGVEAAITTFSFAGTFDGANMVATDFLADGAYLKSATWATFTGNKMIMGTMTIVINDITLTINLFKM